MPRIIDMFAKAFRRLPREDEGLRDRIRAEAAAVSEEQEILAPLIKEQTSYLVEKGRINGFTRQLQIGFERRAGGE